MKSYKYRVTVEMIEDNAGKPVAPNTRSLIFETTNHDDILAINDRVLAIGEFDLENSAALAVGLKLFSEVMLKQKANPFAVDLFGALKTEIGDFIKRLKTSAKKRP